ncbi:MAG: amidinotransferase family protein [Herminiimonas sp.]|nr:amidinotransferase family protein [Herminiimonas sp.]
MTDRLLMCAPDYFEVAYVINPWMEGNVARGNSNAAMRQWNALARLIGKVAQVERVAAVPGVPDMVFTANAGLVLENRFVLSRFRHAERQGEEPHFAKWFADQGFEVLTLPPDMAFEGAGDALLDRQAPLLWLGHGHRSDAACAPLLANRLDMEIQPLKLVDQRFYHLDTCFCPLEGGYLLYYPVAFDIASQASIAARVPAEYRIPVADADAFDFACNAVNCGRNIFLNRASDALTGELRSRGFAVRQTPLTEFMKAGGSAKCLTLKLTEAQPLPVKAVA